MDNITIHDLQRRAAEPGAGRDDALMQFLQAICRTNTGSVLCDSGGAYGYIYDQPSKTAPVDDENLSISTAHHLQACLVVDRECVEMQARLDDFAAEYDGSWLGAGDEFLGRMHDLNLIDFTAEFSHPKWANTYNFDNDLDQVLQFIIFNRLGYIAENDDQVFDELMILIQVHTGCDVRSGYTRPWVFKFVGDPSTDALYYFFDFMLRGYVQDPRDDDPWLESAYQIDENCEWDGKSWTLPDGRAVELSCTAYGW